MPLQDSILKFTDLEELVRLFKYECQQTKRPPEEVIYDDVDLRNFLKVSKRTTASWREKGLITFSKLGGKIYYRLSDILLFIKQHEIPAVAANLKIAL
jgi:helix-turn-helix protein